MAKNKPEADPKPETTPATPPYAPEHDRDPDRDRDYGDETGATTLPGGLTQEEFDALPDKTKQEMSLGTETVEQARKRAEERARLEGEPGAEYDREGNLVKPVQGAPDVYDRDYDLKGVLHTGGPLPRADDPIYDRAGRPQSGSTLPPDDKKPKPYVADKLGDPTRNYTGEDTLHPSPGREDTLKGYRERERVAQRDGRPVPSAEEEEWQRRYNREQKTDRQAGRIPQAQVGKALPPDGQPYVGDDLGDPSRNYTPGKPAVTPPQNPDPKIWGTDPDPDEA